MARSHWPSRPGSRPSAHEDERFPNCGHGVYRDDRQRAFALLRELLTL
jgi:hypothetical protein